MRILVIDDDARFCRLMRDYLTQMGFEVVLAQDIRLFNDARSSAAAASVVGMVIQKFAVAMEILDACAV